MEKKKIKHQYGLSRCSYGVWNFKHPPKNEIVANKIKFPILYLNLKKTLKCIEMTPKYSPILWWPKKISTKSLYPPKKFIFLKPPKILKFKILNPKNDPSVRMYENIRVTPPPPGVTVCQIMTPNIIISSTFDEVSEMLRQNQNSHRTHGLDSVLSQVQCHVQLYQMTSSSSCKLAIWSLWTYSVMGFTKIHFWKWFQQWYLCFIPESCVSDNPIRYKRPLTPTNAREWPRILPRYH